VSEFKDIMNQLKIMLKLENFEISKFLFTFCNFNILSPLTHPAQAVTTNDDELDISALDAFCQIIKNEPEVAAAAARMLAFKSQSTSTKEALLALDAFEGEKSINFLSFTKR
jgi:hypothetical protein